MGYQPVPEGRDALFKYCIGEYNQFTLVTLRALIDILSDILCWNRKSCCFSAKSLREECASAVLRSKEQSALSETDKSKAYRYGVQRGLFSLAMRLKLLYHKMFR